MKKIFVLFLLLSGVSFSTIAQTNTSSFEEYRVLPQNYDWSETTLIQDETIQLKNPNTAMWISVGSTVGSYVLYLALVSAESESIFLYTFTSLSLLAAPALGYVYTNNWDDFWSSVSRRFVGRLVMGAGAIIILVEALDNIWSSDDPDNLVIAAGLGLLLGGAIYNLTVTFRDFRQVRTRVYEYNEGLVKSVQIMPAVDPINKSLGVGFRVNF